MTDRETTQTSTEAPKISAFWGVVRGDGDLHVWRSYKYPDVLLDTAWSTVGAPLDAAIKDPIDDKLVKFSLELEPFYAGILSASEAEERAIANDRARAQSEMED
jgi:hypothetical protein